ncbi:MAG TPA: 3-hydroxyacyl-CoA dehydrogenase NAD-binding domain-containing protein [Deinococcales bacterium]|nr:3-hydroxyacyl-CoA dehydrogenase NAD-binding domain-containing protein [Deinococcales bacterium]
MNSSSDGVVRTIGVVGAGQMGSGIAQVAATAGFQVLLHDLDPAFIERGRARIEDSLGKLEAKGRLPEPAAGILERLRVAPDLNGLAGADLVVEAIIEREEDKARLYRALAEVLSPEAMLASNTSSLPITRLAAAYGRPEQFIGMHFMNPVPLMPLIEVIRGHLTSQETLDAVLAVGRAMGKTPVAVEDYPGFVANRILLPMINEAIGCVLEGVAAPEAVDQIMKLGANHPMGPLQLADFIGLDTCLAILEVLHEGLGDPRYRPSPLLRRMVQAGLLGRKSGRGFYEYGT